MGIRVPGKKKYFISIISVSIFLLIGSFQNCSNTSTTKFSNSKSLSSLESSLSGNGSGYDGKPEPGEYDRVLPGKCDETERFSTLNITSLVAEVSKDSCQPTTYTIDFKDSRMNFSGYNPDYISINSGIFERKTVSVAENLPYVETFCSWKNESDGLDVIIKKSKNGKTFAKIYQGNNIYSSTIQSRLTKLFEVSSNLNSSRVSYSSNEYSFSLEINGLQNNLETFNGYLISTIDQKRNELNLECRFLNDKPTVIDPTNLIAFWQFEQPAGPLLDNTLIADTTGQNSSSPFINPDNIGGAIVTGPSGNALHLDGNDDYMRVDFLTPLLTNKNAITISGKFRSTGMTGTRDLIFGHYDFDGINKVLISIGECGTNAFINQFSVEMDDTNCLNNGSNTYDGNWHSFVYIFSNGLHKAFFDGVTVDSVNVPIQFESTDIFTIGGDLDSGLSPDDFFNGELDEIAVWDRALSDSEALDLSQGLH